MRTRHTSWISAAILIMLVIGGCGTTTDIADERATPPPGRSTDDLEVIFRERQENARTRFTEADVQFMTGMIAHHAQALAMAALAPTHGAGAEVQTLAARIDNAQRDEIATMQTWLRDRGQPVPEIHIDGIEVMVHDGSDHAMHRGGDHATLMPGMLTPEQLQQLDEARGTEFERLFLEYMIQHHTGAVTMVHDLFSTAGAAQDEAAFRFASDVQVDQITEVERMERMLETLLRTIDDP